MKFLDKAKIFIKAGDGGNGSAAMRARPHGEKHTMSGVISRELICAQHVAAASQVQCKRQI
ncbi:MAG: hypothetical protein LBJ73_03370 [Rickettsiales bacterium]|nr:hypothetical protein [Rickettsiales bacterium]